MGDLLERLQYIHTKVQNHFTYQTDLEQYNALEKWVMPDGTKAFIGDCEDFAMACRKLCREVGIKTRLVVCSMDGEGHCVLEANGWILDNNSRTVVRRDDLDYTWLSISGYEPGEDWHAL